MIPQRVAVGILCGKFLESMNDEEEFLVFDDDGAVFGFIWATAYAIAGV